MHKSYFFRGSYVVLQCVVPPSPAPEKVASVLLWEEENKCHVSRKGVKESKQAVEVLQFLIKMAKNRDIFVLFFKTTIQIQQLIIYLSAVFP